MSPQEISAVRKRDVSIFDVIYCEIVSTKLATLQFVSKSFGYIAILCLTIVIGFVVIMDVLKYGFEIDPTKHELERICREKA